MTDTWTPNPPVDMGTFDEAKARCLAAWKRWCEFRQPFMGTATEQRKREALGQEAQFQFANAAALLCWHLEREHIGEELHQSTPHLGKIERDPLNVPSSQDDTQ